LYVETSLFEKKQAAGEKKKDFMIAVIKLICIFVAVKGASKGVF
jgi:hypothetical protein